LAPLYSKSYQLAYSLARQAERAFGLELGKAETAFTFIQRDNWDSLRRGLVAGERLHHDLMRLQAAYLEQHTRDYELTKHISLADLDPLALITLRQTGECYLRMSEQLFDFDYPGHYLRRIKSMSLTIPCVTGPYTSVNCTLTLVSNSIRVSPGIDGE